MKPLTIEIHGTGIHNRGAELMSIAIAERMRSTFPDVRIVVSSWFGSAQDISRYGFLNHWENAGKFGMMRSVLRLVQTIGQKDVISPADVDVVLDASGFGFSDQWGSRQARILTQKMNRFYRKKQPLILLPQALGGFENPEVAAWCRKLFERASFVCARDTQSFAYAKPLVATEKIRLYPDFTIGVSAKIPADMNIPQNFAAIVPNMRMLDKTGESEAYLEFLRHAVERISSAGLVPTFLIHDAHEDKRVIELMGERYMQLPVLTHSDPRVLKGILGKANFVIGSRFHALVSALSQGVPCIGAGWSHKYPELFRDFSCQHLLISDLSDKHLLETTIDKLCSSSSRNKIAEDIRESSEKMKKRVIAMWTEVESSIKHAIDRKK